MKLQEEIEGLIDQEKIICKIHEGFKLDNKINNDVINKIFEYYTCFRKQTEIMEYKMYLRGISDCFKLFKKVNK